MKKVEVIHKYGALGRTVRVIEVEDSVARGMCRLGVARPLRSRLEAAPTRKKDTRAEAAAAGGNEPRLEAAPTKQGKTPRR